MSKKKVLLVTQELDPYTAFSEVSVMARQLPQYILEKGMEIRVLMPRYGSINERRHRLHEVVRLSGMNIIVDDDDFPLIIKVASFPGARLQVYFLDNDDFFKRKEVFEEEDGTPFSDNADRMIFFCKGVLETVKKFGWAPDIIHCHGWITSLIPLYVKSAYRREPLFQDAKVVYSLYDKTYDQSFGDTFFSKASINNMDSEQLDAYKDGQGVSLHGGAIHFADAIVIGSEQLEASVLDKLALSDKPILPYQEVSQYAEACIDFYFSLFEEKVES